MKIRFIIKEQEEIKPVESPEQINIKRDNLKAEIQSELSALNLSTVTPEQLQNLLDQIKTIKGKDTSIIGEKKSKKKK
jgi:sRNA-binding carbon storage regulator CsrA